MCPEIVDNDEYRKLFEKPDPWYKMTTATKTRWN